MTFAGKLFPNPFSPQKEQNISPGRQCKLHYSPNLWPAVFFNNRKNVSAPKGQTSALEVTHAQIRISYQIRCWLEINFENKQV
jgi:hypothetical protein